MKFIKNSTEEVYTSVASLKESLQIKLPSILTKQILEDNGISYLYDGYTPKPSIFKKIEENGIKIIDGQYFVDYKEEEIWGTTEEKQSVLDSKLTQEKANKVQELKKSLDKLVDESLLDTTGSEKLSWGKQETEARAYTLDNNVVTPYLSTLVISRNKNETVAELSQKIIDRADKYSVFHANLLGQYHAKLVEVDAVTATIEDLDDTLVLLSGINIILE